MAWGEFSCYTFGSSGVWRGFIARCASGFSGCGVGLILCRTCRVSGVWRIFIFRLASGVSRCSVGLSSALCFGAEESVACFICVVFSSGLAVWGFRVADSEIKSSF